MKTLILPGYSLKNKDWSEKTQREMSPAIVSKVIYWPHWKTERPEKGWIEKETGKILENEKSQINVIAKSIGTIVAMKILKSNPQLINKIILCGIPIYNFHSGDDKFYQAMKLISTDKILCLQNENDNHGSFADVEKFVHKINQNVKVVSKPQSDHNYPYSNDFIKFLHELQTSPKLNN